MGETGDIVVSLCYEEFSFSYDIPIRKFPILFDINSKVFIVKDNICKGYFNVRTIIPHGRLKIVKFSSFHQIKQIAIKDFWGLWKYRNFNYTPIKKEVNKTRIERFKDRVIRSKIPDGFKQYLLQNGGISLSLEELSYNN